MLLVTALLYSGIIMGLSLLIVNTNSNISWNELSDTWHFIFYAEGVLFLVQIVLIILRLINNSMADKLIYSFANVIYSYKMILDPFITVLMEAKSFGVYDEYLSIVKEILLAGFTLQIVLVSALIYLDKKYKRDVPAIKFLLYTITPFIVTSLFFIRIIWEYNLFDNSDFFIRIIWKYNLYKGNSIIIDMLLLLLMTIVSLFYLFIFFNDLEIAILKKARKRIIYKKGLKKKKKRRKKRRK